MDVGVVRAMSDLTSGTDHIASFMPREGPLSISKRIENKDEEALPVDQ